ncbi:CGGC domain-containing protein [Calditrichota bacterium LG25]
MEEQNSSKVVKIGIIICDRYRNCTGGKCLRALKNREGAFSYYQDVNVELVGYTTCGGCPGGNIEYAPAEMKKNGVDVIHLATGLLVGYPPCPYLKYFKEFIEMHHQIKVVYGTHPIPQSYFLTHQELGSWDSPEWKEIITPELTIEDQRLSYS